jgi:hypothetical protein
MSSRYTVQSCRNEEDISGDLHAAEDADEIRVWDQEQNAVLLMVAKKADGQWTYGASDVFMSTVEEMGAPYRTWVEAFAGFGITIDPSSEEVTAVVYPE